MKNINCARRIFLLTTAMIIPFSSAHAIGTLTTPTGEIVTTGSATFDRPAAGQLNINQNTNRAIINWDSFNIGRDATTEFFQPGASSLAVNRVRGSGADPTQILGTLRANGKLMVLDRNGVLFGKNSIVDVAGIVTSTGDVTDADIMDGNDTFEIFDATQGSIENRGTISVADAGLAAFVAPTVRNSGIINAKFGRVELASGSTATVDLFGDNLVELAVDSELEHALVENRGDILAEAGNVQITTRVAKDIVDNSINMSGIVNVSSIDQQGGTIILAGAEDTTIRGKLLANSMAGGGAITVDSGDIGIHRNARLAADTTFTGVGGKVALRADNSIDTKGKITANGEEAGGTVTIDAGDSVNVAGRTEARATGVSGGGLIRVTSGGDETRIDSTLRTTGIDGAGKIILAAANTLTLTDDSRLLAESLSTGRGGDISLDGHDVAMDGRISVNGKEGGGNVRAQSTGKLDVNGNISGIGEVIGTGGRVRLESEDDIVLNSTINMSGVGGGGQIVAEGKNVTVTEDARLYARGLETDLPDFQHNPGGAILINADETANVGGILSTNGYTDGAGFIRLSGEDVDVENTAIIQSNAVRTGDGGRIHLNGTSSNTFGGRIFARGGAVSGDGGNVTFDTPNTIEPGSSVDVSSPNGNDGTFNH